MNEEDISINDEDILTDTNINLINDENNLATEEENSINDEDILINNEETVEYVDNLIRESENEHLNSRPSQLLTTINNITEEITNNITEQINNNITEEITNQSPINLLINSYRSELVNNNSEINNEERNVNQENDQNMNEKQNNSNLKTKRYDSDITCEDETNGILMIFIDNVKKKIEPTNVNISYTRLIKRYGNIDNTLNDLEIIQIEGILHLLYKKYYNSLLIPIYQGEIINKNIRISSLKSPLLIINKKIDSFTDRFSSNFTTNLISNMFHNISNNLITNRNTNTDINTSTSTEINTNTNTEINADIPINIEEPINVNNTNIVNSNNLLFNYLNSNTINPAYMEQYKDELSQMNNMGFTDKNKALQALIVSDGNVENAINYYLN